MEKKDGGPASEKSNKCSTKYQETTVIRISSKNYEALRREAFYKRSTIREVADDILKEELQSTWSMNDRNYIEEEQTS